MRETNTRMCIMMCLMNLFGIKLVPLQQVQSPKTTQSGGTKLTNQHAIMMAFIAP